MGISHLLAAVNACKIGFPPRLSHEDAAGGMNIFLCAKQYLLQIFTWDFSIIGLILSARKSILFNNTPQEGINIIYPFQNY